MFATVVLVLAALWMLVIGSLMTVKNGGILAGVLYKALPIGLSFGLALIAFHVV
jgi:hypothetical protein